MKLNLSLRNKLFLNFLVVAVITLMLSGVINYWVSGQELEKAAGASISKSAADISDKIDRNLFERYGDVQAFQYNKIPTATNRATLTSFMNNMMQYYAPIYQLMILTDQTGRVIAVNTVDKGNKAIDSSYLIGKDFSESTWFKQSISGQIKAGQAFLEEPSFDEDVKKIFSESNGYTMNFSSPVFDAAGNIIGTWTNRMDVANINQIILDNLTVERDKGLSSAKVVLISSEGKTIYDQEGNKLNENGLATLPLGVKELLNTQKDGYLIDSNIIYGVVRSKGFASYPARNWAIIFSVDYPDAMKGLGTLKYANIGILIVSLIIAGLLTLFATKSITDPINGLVFVAEQVSRGDLAQKLPDTFLKSDQRLAGAFSTMMNNLRSLVTQVQTTANHVATASKELSETTSQTSTATEQITSAIVHVADGNSGQVSSVTEVMGQVNKLNESIELINQGAQEQKSGIDTAGNIIQEMADGIAEDRLNAQTILKSAGQSTETANQGSIAVKRTIEEMHLIRKSVLEVANKIKDLGDKSVQIGEIVQVIDDIAEQTNLLALNAAIEAARAGEQGKGFAVVADEVRKLAERSGKATKEISQLITGMQEGTNNAVKAMNQSTIEVENGVAVADKTEEALKQIINEIKETELQAENITTLTKEVAHKSEQAVSISSQMSEISFRNITMTKEMTTNSFEVDAAIRNIAGITNQNAATTQELSASSEEIGASIQEIAASTQKLSAMAQALQDEIVKFKV